MTTSDQVLSAKRTLSLAANAYSILDDDVRRLSTQILELRVLRRKKAMLLREARIALARLEGRRPRD